MSALQVQNIDWQKSANRRAHHTDKFYSQQLIVRRGQLWEIIIICNRSLESEESLDLTVYTGPSPSESARTKATFPVSGEYRWLERRAQRQQRE